MDTDIEQEIKSFLNKEKSRSHTCFAWKLLQILKSAGLVFRFILLFSLIKALQVLIFKACLQWETVISLKLWIVKPAALCWDVKPQLALEVQLNSMNSRVLMLAPLPLIVLARFLTAPTLKVMYCTDVSNMTFNLLSSKSALPWAL